MREIYVEADLEAIKYFKLSEIEDLEMLKTGICKLNKKNENSRFYKRFLHRSKKKGEIK